MVELQTYYDFIAECTSKQYDCPVHKHHILPRFMGGLDTADNKVNLSYEDHLQAHLLLADQFEEGSKEYIGNMSAAKMLSMWWANGVDDEIGKRIGKKMRGKNHPLFGRKRPDLAQKGERNPMFGKKRDHSRETRLKISQGVRKRNETLYPLYDGVFECDVIIDRKRKKFYKECSVEGCSNKTYYTRRSNAREAFKNKSMCLECKNRLLAHRSSNSRGKVISEESRRKMREAAKTKDYSNIGKYNKFGNKNPNAKAIKNVKTGEVFSYMKLAVQKEKITIDVLRRLIKEGKYEMVG